MNTYYHNPKCSKSRAGLEVLNKHNIDFAIKEYLNEPMTNEELVSVLQKLDKTPSDIIRSKEQIYLDLDLGSKDLNRDQWVQTIIENPKLMERPIFVTEHSAVIGRPTEELEKFLAKSL